VPPVRQDRVLRRDARRKGAVATDAGADRGARAGHAAVVPRPAEHAAAPAAVADDRGRHERQRVAQLHGVAAVAVAVAPRHGPHRAPVCRGLARPPLPSPLLRLSFPGCSLPCLAWLLSPLSFLIAWPPCIQCPRRLFRTASIRIFGAGRLFVLLLLLLLS